MMEGGRGGNVTINWERMMLLALKRGRDSPGAGAGAGLYLILHGSVFLAGG